jgi:hypothetical protein
VGIADTACDVADCLHIFTSIFFPSQHPKEASESLGSSDSPLLQSAVGSTESVDSITTDNIRTHEK